MGQQTANRVGSLMSQHAGREQQADQFGQQMDLQQDRLDLEGAKAGFERGGGDSRAQQLEQEMARGAEQTGVGPLDPESQDRLRGQTSQGLEHEGGKWRSTQEAKEQRDTANKLNAFKADTERVRAETYRDQVGLQVQRAQAAGKREEARALAKPMADGINGDVKKFDRFMNGTPTENDWSDLAKYAGESNQLDPTLIEEIKNRNWGPRTQQFLRSHISRESLKFVARTGMTGGLEVDWTAPPMRSFAEQAWQTNAMAKSLGPEFSQIAQIKSVEDKMEFVNTHAAMTVLTGMDQAQAPDPTQGMPGSLGGPAPEGGMAEPPMDPNAVAAQDAGQRDGRGMMTPVQNVLGDDPASDEATQEAIRRRQMGQPVPPADSPLFNQLMRPK